MAKLFKFKNSWFLFAILIAAFLIRFVGLIPGHNPNHPDEPMSYGSVIEMFEHNDLNPRRFDYPAGVPLLHYVIYKTYILPVVFFLRYVLHPRAIPSILLHSSTFVAEHKNEIFGKGDILALFWSRFITAIIGILSLCMTYLIAKKLFNRTAGLAAAFFLAFNYRHVLSSHLALSDVPNSFFALLAFFASLLLLEKNTRNRYLFCGFCVGLSISMKYQIFTLVPFFFVHALWAVRKKKLSSLFHKDFVISVVLICLLVATINIYIFFNFQSAMTWFTIISLRYGAGANRLNLYPLVYLYHWGIGPGTSIAIIIGFFLSLVAFPLQTLLLLTYVGPFLYVFLYYMTGGTYIRNFTTVIPFLMIFAGFAYAFIVTNVLRRFNTHLATIGAIALLLLMNVHSIKDFFLLSRSYAQAWNKQVLAEWAYDHLPSNSKVLNANVGLPPPTEKPIILTPWNHTKENSIPELAEAGYDFAILNTDWYQIYLSWFGLPFPTIMHGIPFHILSESYYGLAMQDFLRYAIYEVYKPWQAPDNNYVVIKVPLIAKTVDTVAAFHFDTDLEGWNMYTEHKTPELFYDAMVGHQNSGSLLLSTDSVRLISPFIPIRPDTLYTVEGYLRPEIALESSERDAFLRVDFYRSKNLDSIMQSAVSGRLYGPITWHKLWVASRAPEGSQFLTISIGRSNPQKTYRYFVDDVIISASDSPKEVNPELPYIHPTIPSSVLFPTSIY